MPENLVFRASKVLQWVLLMFVWFLFLTYPLNKDVPSSEDCLTINVFRPAGIFPGHSLLPVMVFIHGGGFVGKSCFSSVTAFPYILFQREVL